MDLYTVKVKILDEIAKSTVLLQPRDSHVYGNWHVQSWTAQRANFPIVTVRMEGDLMPVWSRKPPTVPFGEIYLYNFSLFVFADSMHNSRLIADIIIDYFQLHNKFPDVKIIDVINFTSKESILQKGPKRYWRTIVTFRVMTEEALT